MKRLRIPTESHAGSIAHVICDRPRDGLCNEFAGSRRRRERRHSRDIVSSPLQLPDDSRDGRQ
jgi:hypothetical protein